MMKFVKTHGSFTLIELLIVIAIIVILASALMGNVFTSLKKSRDSRRKIDLQNIQKSIEMYYEDKRAYPANLDLKNAGVNAKLCYGGIDAGCDTPGVPNTKTYMLKIPKDPRSSCNYFYEYHQSSDPSGSGEGYELYSALEMGTADVGPGSGVYDANCGSGDCSPCRFKVSSSNYQ